MTAGQSVAVLATAVLAATSPDRAQMKAKAMDDVVAINFSRDVGWSGQESLELVSGSASTVALSFNHDGRPEIGVWRGIISSERFDAALAAIRLSGYEALPAPSVFEPGSKFLSLGVRRAGERTPRMRAFDLRRPPPQVAAPVALLDAVIADIRKHPLRVLRGHVAVGEPRTARGRDLSLDLVLTNAGIEPLRLSNPKAGRANDWNGIRLVFVDRRGNEHSLDLTPASVSSDMSAAARLLSLAAGANVHLLVRTKIDWPAGAGHLRVELHQLAADPGDPSVIDGSLWLDAGPLTVERGSWWKFWQ